MSYKWNGDCLGAMVGLPAAVVDNELRLAERGPLKVLLWFARHGTFDAAACAAATGISPADCRDAMNYWVERGVLLAEAEEPALPVSLPAAAPVVPVAPPTRPSFVEVVARQKTCADFDYLLKTAEQRLGRAITPGEMETFLYLYDTVGLPAEVIVMIVVYAVQNGKVKSRSGFRTYIEKVGLSWLEQGIITVAAAEEELCRQERRNAVRRHIEELFSLARPLTLLQVEAAQQWVEEWHFSDEVLLVALAKCREKTGGFNANYLTRMLESWHADGITTKQAAEEAVAPKRRQNAKPLMADDTAGGPSDDYERAAADWRPIYKK